MDRNTTDEVLTNEEQVALRKESVDRNTTLKCSLASVFTVALRKESVDRNVKATTLNRYDFASLSARRAWIEIVV